jgi:predicted nuclease of predicted toxin-antitoxin system
MARILLDQGLPFRSAALLRANGVDAVHAGEIGLASADDGVILGYARNRGMVCITLDHDFHALLAETGAHAPSTIFIRGQKLDYIHAAEFIRRLVLQLGGELDNGVAVTATARGVRLRKLPLK